MSAGRIPISEPKGKLGVLMPGMGHLGQGTDGQLFIQLMTLKNTLRYLRGEELITHLGLEYYD